MQKLAKVGPGADYLAEARVRSTATGRPQAAATRERQYGG
jgi:hypothetical protein